MALVRRGFGGGATPAARSARVSTTRVRRAVDANRGAQLVTGEVPDRPTDPPQVCLLGVQDVEDDLATFATAAARAFSKLTTGCRLRRAIEGNPAPFQESGEADKLRLADR